MKTVSTAFHQMAFGAIRYPVVEAGIVWSDPYIDPNITDFVTDENRVSFIDQTHNLNETPACKWAYLGPEIIADGTFCCCPIVSEVEHELGWWSALLSDSDGEFGFPEPTLSLMFPVRPILGILVVGDSIYNHFPVDFTVTIYDESDTLLYTHEVTDNAELRYTADISSQNILAAAKMSLQITKINTANDIIKVTEFFTSIGASYTGDEIISVSVMSEMEGQSNTPIGAVTANEIDLTLQNIRIGSDVEFPFNPFNSLSVYHTLLRPNRKITVYGGFKIDGTDELVTLGTFWSDEWTVDESTGSVSTTGYDRFSLLQKSKYLAGTLYQDITLFDLATAIFTHARNAIPMPDLQWSIDTSYSEITLAYAYFEEIDYMELIKKIVVSKPGKAYFNENDILILE